MILYQHEPDGSYLVHCGLNIDGDGANGISGGIACYVPVGSGLPNLDYLANAGHPGNWWGIYCNGGIPVLQDASMPVPGAYISTTSLQLHQHPANRPERYIDAVAVPFIVVPKKFIDAVPGIVLGCRATAEYKGVIIEAVSADVGPDFGEGSIALAKALGIPGSPKSGGVTGGVIMRIYPGTPAVVNGITYALQPS